MTDENQITKALDEADRLLTGGHYAQAVERLENLRAKYPDEEPVLLRLAWAFWDNGDAAKSIDCWEALLERELRHRVFTGFAYDELVRIYKQEGRIRDLIRVCEKTVAVQTDDVGILTEMGLTYLLAGENQKACDVFKKLTDMENDNPAFYCRLGEALLAAGDTASCDQAFEEAARLDPEEADRYFFQAAHLHGKINDAPGALRLLERCRSIAPSNSLYDCALGDVLITLGRMDDAFAAYENACRNNPHHAAAYYNRLGNSLMKAEAFAPAIRAFKTALSLDPQTPCLQNLEKACQATGQPAAL